MPSVIQCALYAALMICSAVSSAVAQTGSASVGGLVRPNQGVVNKPLVDEKVDREVNPSSTGIMDKFSALNVDGLYASVKAAYQYNDALHGGSVAVGCPFSTWLRVELEGSSLSGTSSHEETVNKYMTRRVHDNHDIRALKLLGYATLPVGDSFVKPYGILGVGYSNETYSSDSNNNNYSFSNFIKNRSSGGGGLVLDIGLGAECALFENWNLDVSCRYTARNNVSDLLFSLGIRYHF